MDWIAVSFFLFREYIYILGERQLCLFWFLVVWIVRYPSFTSLFVLCCNEMNLELLLSSNWLKSSTQSKSLQNSNVIFLLKLFFHSRHCHPQWRHEALLWRHSIHAASGIIHTRKKKPAASQIMSHLPLNEANSYVELRFLLCTFVCFLVILVRPPTNSLIAREIV